MVRSPGVGVNGTGRAEALLVSFWGGGAGARSPGLGQTERAGREPLLVSFWGGGAGARSPGLGVNGTGGAQALLVSFWGRAGLGPCSPGCWPNGTGRGNSAGFVLGEAGLWPAPRGLDQTERAGRKLCWFRFGEGAVLGPAPRGLSQTERAGRKLCWFRFWEGAVLGLAPLVLVKRSGQGESSAGFVLGRGSCGPLPRVGVNGTGRAEALLVSFWGGGARARSPGVGQTERAGRNL